MKVYRGPSTLPFIDDKHEFVSRISPRQLEQGVRDNALIRFNITKNGNARSAVCTVHFEDDDIIPMIEGLLARLKVQHSSLASIRAALETTDRPSLKVVKIEAALLRT